MWWFRFSPQPQDWSTIVKPYTTLYLSIFIIILDPKCYNYYEINTNQVEYLYG